jgi:electron transfer flavoprotein beta subunit
MRILAAIKRVPITGGRIVLTEDARAIDTRHLGFTMSPHEECGVEEAVRLIEANKGDSVVITLGPPEAVEQLRDAMALGIDRAIHLQTESHEFDAEATATALTDAGRAQGALSNQDEEWDAEATATALTEAIRADEAGSGRFDIIFFGNESADAGGFQVGARVAHALGRPCVTGLKRVAIEGSSVRCEQEVEGGRDVYTVPLPVVLTVKEGLNLPRYPSVPGKMRARNKPVAVTAPTRPAPRLELISLAVPAGQGRRAESLGSGAAAAPAVVELLRKAGVL